MKKRMAIVFLISLFIGVSPVFATSASISVSTGSTVVGNSGSATLTISSSDVLGQIYGTFSCGGLGSKDLTYVNNDGSPSRNKSYTIYWTARSAGTYTCSVSGLAVGTLNHPENGVSSLGATSKTIKVISGGNSSGGSSSSGGTGWGSGNSSAEKKEYSSDNNLASLSIEGYDLDPKFSKDTTTYKLTVDEAVEKIKVNAKANHDKASVKGTGEINLSSGENTIEIKVTAENGNEKVYKLIVTVVDQHPINVTVDKKNYTIVKKNKDFIDKLDGYEETSVSIDKQDVVAYRNAKTKVTLVILKDKDNKLAYYVYNSKDKSYERYRSITVQGVTLQLLDAPDKLEHFSKYSVKIGEETVDVFKIKKSNKVGLIYGTNIKTGNTGYYVYDQNEGTLSKYYDEEINLYKDEVLKMKNYLMIFMGVTAFIFIVFIVISLVCSNKRKKQMAKLMAASQKEKALKESSKGKKKNQS